MSPATVDKRIVEMAFENDQFEKGVGTSLNTIDKLKKALNFEGAAKGLSGISDAAKRVTFGPISDGLEKIASKFSAMSIIGITALTNLVNSAINAGTRIVKALTIEPISAGLNEYETKLGSIQTILANTQKEGTNLKTVTQALDELNAYSDKTIYNFQQMTRNVGTFTAAGVDLKTSVAAIKGIANLAAVSGSNADQASTAMYQLSQALSTGTLKLMDWNSVVNAGMGGQVFQEALKETARVHGVAVDKIIKDEGSFRDSLQKGWVTSEILTETLQKFTGDLNADQLKTMGYSKDQIEAILKLGKTANDAATKVKTFSQLFDTLKEAAQSGWAKTWEIVVGDFEEAKAFMTQANDILGAMIGASADSRNKLLQAWKDLGGRNELIQAVTNTFEGLLSILKPIKEALREIFPPKTAFQLFALTVKLRELSERLKITGTTANTLKRIFKGVFAGLDIVRMLVVAVAKSFRNLLATINPSVVTFGEFLARIGDWVVKLRDSIKNGDSFTVMIQELGRKLQTVVTIVKVFFNSFAEGVKSFKGIKLEGLGAFMDTLTLKFEPLKKLWELTKKIFTLLGKLFSKIAPIFLKLGSVVATGISKFVDNLMAALDNFDPNAVIQVINGGLLAAILVAIRKFVSGGTKVFGGVVDLLDGVKASLEAWQNSLKANTLLKIAAALAVMTVSIVALSLIDPKKLTKALAAMTIMFAQLGTALLGFQKISASINIAQMGTMAIGLLAIATAMLIMTGAIVQLGKLSGKQLLKGVMAIGAMIVLIKIAANELAASSGKMILGAAAMVIFAGALRIFALSVDAFGKIDTDSLIKGLIGVGVLMTELAIFLKATDLSGMGAIKAVGILILAGALLVISLAVEKMASIDTLGLIKGLTAMSTILLGIAAFATLTGGGASLLLVSAGVLVISGAMLLLAESMVKLGAMSWEGVAKGLVAMGVALTIIGAAAYLIPPTLIITAAGLVVMAGALVILADAMTTMGGMTWNEITRGITTLAASLLVLTVGLTAMSGTLPGSAALLVAAAALAVMAPPLKLLGSMQLAEIGRGLLVLAGMFLILGAAGALMGPVIPVLLGLGAAMLLIGGGMALAGVGMLAFATGLTALAAAGTAGAAALVIVATSIVGLIPMLAKQLGLAILTIINTLVEGAPTLAKGVFTLVEIILNGLIKNIPKIVTAVMTLITSIATSLQQNMPTLMKAGNDIMIAFLEGVRQNLGPIGMIGADIITGILNAIALNLPRVVDSAWNLIISWINAMTEAVDAHMPDLITAATKLGVAIVEGLADGISASIGITQDSASELGNTLINSFAQVLGIHSPSRVFTEFGVNIVQALVNAIKSNLSSLSSVFSSVTTTLKNSLQNVVSTMATVGKDIVNGLANGIRNNVSLVLSSASYLATALLNKIFSLFGIHSPSTVMMDISKNLTYSMASGIDKFGVKVIQATEALSKDTIAGFSSLFTKVADVIDANPSFSPTITPVVDMTNIDSTSKQLDSIFGAKSLSVNLASVTAGNIAATQTPISTEGGVSTQPQQAPISFTQINNSPKELSRIEIYRQTTNQLARARRIIGAV